MLRRAAIGTFAAAILLVVACGREITPEPTSSGGNGNLAGHIDLRFRVNGTLAFSTYDYQIVIDTCGQGVPYPNPATNSYKNYSYSFNIGTSPFGVATVYPILIQYKLTTGSNGLTPLPVPLSPSLVSLNTNSNGQGSEFELIFDRAQLDNPLALTQPCSEFTQPPATAAVTGPSVAAGASPLAKSDSIMGVAEAATAAPAATASPNPQPTLPIQSTWIVNFIVLTPAGVPVDSLGQGGSNDTTFSWRPRATTQTVQTAHVDHEATRRFRSAERPERFDCGRRTRQLSVALAPYGMPRATILASASSESTSAAPSVGKTAIETPWPCLLK